MRPPIPFDKIGNHHAYHGAWLLAFGLFQTYMSLHGGIVEGLPYWYTFIGIGIFMIIDDIIEHTITGNTPLRLLYEKIIYPFLKNPKAILRNETSEGQEKR